MKSLFVTLLTICCYAMSYAQQEAQFTQFMFNKLYYNPAYAGSKKNLCLSGIYRKQWIGIERAPESATLHGHGAVLKNRLGLGLSVNYDKIGFTNQVNIATNYAYIIRFKKENFLSIGLRASLGYTQIRWEAAAPTQVGDQAIPGGVSSKVQPNFGAGLYYQAKHWYVGFSVPNLFEQELDFTPTNIGASVVPKIRQHYYWMGGLSFDIAKNVQIQPNVLFKYVANTPLDMDLNLSFVFFEKFLFGTTFRLGDSFDVLIKWQVASQLQIAFAYDITYTPLQQYNAGTIEAMVEYCFIKKNEKVNNPRFF
ncbi:MAG: type IX secretion system membrane protein PorP/SprF [Aureispira sp.]